MPTAAFANLGCKVNQYETEKIADSFAARGFEITDFDQPADVYVINTCSVTGAADRKSRQIARRAARLNARARVVLTGCFAQLALDTGESVEGASLLVPNREKMRVAEHTIAHFPELAPQPRVLGAPNGMAPHPPEPVEPLQNVSFRPSEGRGPRSKKVGFGPPEGAAPPPILGAPEVEGRSSGEAQEPGASWDEPVLGEPAVFPEQAGLIALQRRVDGRPLRLARTRATLKVQDGCTHFCAFCSIPYTRNTMASRSLAAVVDEARRLAGAGVREVVVTGVCVGAYADEDSGARLPRLLAAVADVPGLARVRLSSLQPIETDDALIETLASRRNLCPHLHLSLQSGDDAILAAMQRPYDTAYFRDLVRRLRRRIPGIALTTDIIVGFPGETRSLFDNTLRFAREIGFSRTHVFRYSPRERTYAACELRDDVAPDEKDRRHKELTEVCRRTQADFARRYLGEWTHVLVEGRGRAPGLMSGYTDTYVRVHLPAGPDASGQIVRARIAEVTDDGDAVADSVAAGRRKQDVNLI